MNARPVHLVLDTSAVIAYTTTIDVGETINEVSDNGGGYAVPVVCLAEAAQVVPIDVLDLLVGNEAATLTGLAPDEWRALAAMRALLGRVDVAAAFAAAEANACDILTAEPKLYAPLGDDPPIISIDS
ncbi:MAG TPA: hypothetical protein VFM54_21555 [Micromonosporaceae bacterium]|nr:hypothetical protein [Micromonosporaceae bacterium]